MRFLIPHYRVFTISLLIGAAALAGCSRHPAQSKAALPAVTVAPVEQKEIVEHDEFTGRIEPVETVEIRPRVSGYIQEVKFQSGQLVKKGDLLFQIDPRWQQATFDQRRAEFQQAKAHLENARREAERTPQLLTNNAISLEESDARQSRYEEANSAMLAAQAALDSAKLDLDYTQVRAPIGGRVSRALLTEGNYVNGVAGAATVLTTIVSVDPVYVYADMDENSLLRFNALAVSKRLEADGNGRIPVELQLADEQDFPHKGYIESFDNRLNADTGSILLRAVFPNPDERIVPGLFARIRVPLSDRHPALLVEERAIGTDQAQKFVLTLTSSNTVSYRHVELGPVIGDRRVVRNGLAQNEEIVVNGLQRVRPGMPVAPQQEVAETTEHRLAKR
ncbi:MAG TPA: efflux RND transporter periplasmic adaptor subunit [Verrucomicrobiae bacterium]|nr:efflux RND transporter periplasmic adaptor subunit [Verrucomicrobiae bacterium]